MEFDALKIAMRDHARELGFLDARVAAAHLPPAAGDAYKRWLLHGYQGEMEYMNRLVDERAGGAEHVLPGAKSVIVLAASYYHPECNEKSSPHEVQTEPHTADQHSYAATQGGKAVRIARYALGRDYHYVLKDRLAPLVSWLETQLPGEKFRVCVDSAPLLERSYALASGIGFIGKNCMLITWMQGSFTFLAEIVTTAYIPPDSPRAGTCGNCTRCLDACPTQAFPAPGVLDSRKCISYLTIEKKSELTPEEAAATGEWIFGCDICQDVCPYNKYPEESPVQEFAPGTVVNQLEPVSTFLKAASNRQFERRFTGSPILRPGRRRLHAAIGKKV